MSARKNVVGARRIAMFADRLLACFAEAADTGAPCPSNTTLAATLTTSGSTITRLVRHLEEVGKISVHRFDPRRVVKIVATGRSTAPTELVTTGQWKKGHSPRVWLNPVVMEREKAEAAAREARRACPIEQAKLHLQRTGRIVYSAKVTGGPDDKWIVSGVPHPIASTALVELAVSRGLHP